MHPHRPHSHDGLSSTLPAIQPQDEAHMGVGRLSNALWNRATDEWRRDGTYWPNNMYGREKWMGGDVKLPRVQKKMQAWHPPRLPVQPPPQQQQVITTTSPPIDTHPHPHTIYRGRRSYTPKHDIHDIEPDANINNDAASDEERTLISSVRAYLPNVLYVQRPGDVNITEQDVTRLFHEGMAGRYTLARIQEMAMRGLRYDTMQQLIMAVRQAHSVVEETKGEDVILGYAGGHAREEKENVEEEIIEKSQPPPQRHINPIDLSDRRRIEYRSRIHYFLTGPACLLFRDAPHHIIIHDADIDQLITAAHDHPQRTLSYLYDLNSQGRSFTSMSALITTLRERSMYAYEKEVLVYLAYPKTHSLFGVPRIQIPITPVEIDRLFEESRAGAHVIHHLHSLDRSGRQFSSWHALTLAVRELEDNYIRDMDKLYDFLIDITGTTIWDGLDMAHITTRAAMAVHLNLARVDVERIWEETGAGPATMSHLQTLQSTGKKFNSLDALILAITELEQHDTIHTYLESPQCLLFNKTQDHAGITREHIQQIMEKGKHMGNMLLSVLQDLDRLSYRPTTFDAFLTHLSTLDPTPYLARKELFLQLSYPQHESLLLSSRITPNDVDKIWDESGVGMKLGEYVKRMEYAKNRFKSLDDLITALRHEHSRDTLLTYLSHSCSIFTHAPRHININMGLVDRLLNETMTTGDHILRYLRHMDAMGIRCNDETSLIAAVRARHHTEMHRYNQVLVYLCDKKCKLLDVVTTPISLNDVERLFTEANSGASTIHYLRELSVQSQHYNNMSDLIEAVKTQHTNSQLERWKVAAYLNHTKRQSLLKTRNGDISADQIDYLFDRTRAGSNTLKLLRAMDATGTSFANFDALVEAARCAQMKSNLVEELNALECRIFENAILPITITLKEVDYLWSHGSSGIFTPMYIRDLNRSGYQAQSLDELCTKLCELHTQHMSHRDDVLVFLTYPGHCNLFAGASQHVIITPTDVDRIMEEAHTGVHTLTHLHAMNTRGNKFSSLDELITALSYAHDADLEERNGVMMYLMFQSKMMQGKGEERVKVTYQDIDRLFTLIASTPSTSGRIHILSLLQKMDAQHMQFDTFNTLYRNFATCLKHHLDEQQRVFLYLLYPKHGNLLTTIMTSTGMTLTTADLDLLFSTSDAGTLLYSFLTALDRAGYKFQTLRELIQAIRSTHEAWPQPKKDVLSYLIDKQRCDLLPSHVDVTLEDVDLLFEVTQAGTQLLPHLITLSGQSVRVNTVKELIEPIRALHTAWQSLQLQVLQWLNDSARQRLISSSDLAIMPSGIERLFHECHAGWATWELLIACERAGKRATSLDELIVILSLATSRRQQQIQQVYAWINHRPVDALDINEDLSSITTPYHRFFTPMTRITRAQVERLFLDATSGDATLSHLQSFASQNRTFDTFDALIKATKATHDAIHGDRIAVFNYLSDTHHHHLWHPSSIPDVTWSGVDKLFTQTRAGPSIKGYLIALNDAGSQFHTMDELIRAVKHVVHRDRLLFYLDGNDSNVLQGIGPLTTKMMDHLLQQCGCGLSTLQYVQDLDRLGQSFNSIDELIPVLCQMHETSLEERRRVLFFLSDPAQSKLLTRTHTDNNSPTYEVTITPADIDELFETAGAGLSTMTHLIALQRMDVTFTSLQELIQSIHDMHIQSLHERHRVLVFLTYQKSLFWTEGIHTSRADVDAMFDKTRAGDAVMSHLKTIISTGRSYAKGSDLIPIITTLHERSMVDRGRVRTYLNNTSHQHLLHGTSIEGKITLRLVDQLFDETRAGSLTYSFLQALSRAGYTFGSWLELTSALKAAHDACPIEKRHVLAWLIDASNHKLLDGVRDPVSIITITDIDTLFDKSHADYITLHYLKQAEHARDRFRNMSELIQYVTSAHHTWCKTILTYLMQNRTKLFTHAHELEFNRQHVDALITRTRAGQYLMQYLTYLVDTHRTFTSWDMLCDVIHKMHQRSIQDRRAVLYYLLYPRHTSMFTDGVIITPENVDHLFNDCGAGPFTKQYLMELDTEGHIYDSFGALSRAIQQRHHDIQKWKDDVRQWLRDPRQHHLFGSKQDEITHSITPAIIDTLFERTCCGSTTLTQLQMLNNTGSVFPDMDTLIVTLEEIQAHTVRDKKAVWSWLNDRRQQKLVDIKSICASRRKTTKTDEITLEMIDELFALAKTGPKTLTQLITLDRAEMYPPFTSIETLAVAIRASFEVEVQQKRAVREYCRDIHRCTIWNHGIPIDLETCIERHVGAHTLRLIQLIARSGTKFDTASQLFDAVKRAYEKDSTQRRAIWMYLSDPKQLAICDGDLQLNRSQIDQLVDQFDVDTATISDYLHTLDRNGVRVRTFHQLMDRVMDIHKQSQQDHMIVRQWLRDASQCQLFGSDGLVPLPEGLDHLYDAAGAGTFTLAYLRQLNRDGHKFQTTADLIHAVKMMHQEMMVQKRLCFNYLNDEYQSALLTPNPVTRLAVRIVDIDRIFDTTGLHDRIIHILRQLESLHHHYDSVDALIMSIMNPPPLVMRVSPASRPTSAGRIVYTQASPAMPKPASKPINDLHGQDPLVTEPIKRPPADDLDLPNIDEQSQAEAIVTSTLPASISRQASVSSARVVDILGVRMADDHDPSPSNLGSRHEDQPTQQAVENETTNVQNE